MVENRSAFIFYISLQKIYTTYFVSLCSALNVKIEISSLIVFLVEPFEMWFLVVGPPTTNLNQKDYFICALKIILKFSSNTKIKTQHFLQIIVFVLRKGNIYSSANVQTSCWCANNLLYTWFAYYLPAIALHHRFITDLKSHLTFKYTLGCGMYISLPLMDYKSLLKISQHLLHTIIACLLLVYSQIL